MKTIFGLLAVIVLSVNAWAGDFNHLTPAEYDSMAKTALQELKDHPDKIAAAAKEYLLKSNLLDPSNKLAKIYDVDPAFTVHSMLFILAINNHIKRDRVFTDAYTQEARTVSRSLEDKDLILAVGALLQNYIDQNDKLPAVASH